MPPTVTVLMPAYNAERYVAEAVRSMLDQTCRDFELLLIDDGSTDGTLSALAGFCDARLRIERNPRNLGLIATLNMGLGLAHGRYVARMDADDVAWPNRLERQVAYLEAHPDIAVVGSWVDLIDAEGRIFSCLHYPTEPDAIANLLIEECCLVHPTVVFRRDVVIAAGGYDPAARHAEDYDLWLRLSEKHPLANLPEPLLGYRMHPGQVSITKLPSQYATSQVVREAALARRAARGLDTRAMARVIRPGWRQRVRARPCTLGRNYLDWHYQYRTMKSPRLALAFAAKALVQSPLSGEAWRGVAVGLVQCTVPLHVRRAAVWYAARLRQLVGTRNRAA